jgi:hypothetical protein
MSESSQSPPIPPAGPELLREVDFLCDNYDLGPDCTLSVSDSDEPVATCVRCETIRARLTALAEVLDGVTAERLGELFLLAYPESARSESEAGMVLHDLLAPLVPGYEQRWWPDGIPAALLSPPSPAAGPRR